LKSFSIASSVSLPLADSAVAIRDDARLPLAITLPTSSAARAATVTSSGAGTADPRMALSLAQASSMARLDAATKPVWALRKASYCLSRSATASSRSRGSALPRRCS
jgi:hypothetical protein